AFEWNGGDTPEIARQVAKIIGETVPQGFADNFLASARAMIQGRLIGAELPNLGLDAKEQFPTRFWGNIEELKAKILQARMRGDGAFRGKLLGVNEIAGALSSLWLQAWKRIDVPPAGPGGD